MSGAVISWRGCCLKCFSRRQEVPALSSAEAEAIAITEASKELVALGTLIETARDGIPLDEIGVPAKTTGSMKLHLYNDGKAAVSISTKEGLLRRVKHMELRAHYVKYLHRRRRLTLEHWEVGVSNPEKLQAHRDVAEPLQCCRTCTGFGFCSVVQCFEFC